MSYELELAVLSFIMTIVLSLCILPILKKIKIGQFEREDGPQSHLKKSGTPTMGGIIMGIALLIISVFVIIKTGDWKILALTVAAIGFGIIGFCDDVKKVIFKDTKGLSPKLKMLGLLIISVTYTIYILKFLNIGTDIYIPFLNIFLSLPVWIYIPFTVLVMLATTNAVNLTDGVDGLATIIVSIMVACLSIIAISFENVLIYNFGLIVLGICLGFLIFNIAPAKMFMGDTGSLMLGGIVSVMAIYLKVPLILLIIALVPIAETLSVVMQVAYYKKTKKRFFKMAPIHHHFELSGWSEQKVVIVFGLITMVLSGLMLLNFI